MSRVSPYASFELYRFSARLTAEQSSVKASLFTKDLVANHAI